MCTIFLLNLQPSSPKGIGGKDRHSSSSSSSLYDFKMYNEKIIIKHTL